MKKEHHQDNFIRRGILQSTLIAFFPDPHNIIGSLHTHVSHSRDDLNCEHNKALVY